VSAIPPSAVHHYQPHLAAAAVYDDCFGRWRRAYEHQLALADEGVTTPLWRAPGQA
jgi:autoinducer-2 kinase